MMQGYVSSIPVVLKLNDLNQFLLSATEALDWPKHTNINLFIDFDSIVSSIADSMNRYFFLTVVLRTI